MSQALLLTCEHATNHIPKAYRSLFTRDPGVLETHRGIDLGAFALAQDFARKTRAPLVTAKVSRLLVELNRSPGPKVFSEFVTLDDTAKNELVTTYYEPHRQAVLERVKDSIENNLLVIHVGVHSFTPVLKGETRRADVGLLFDPRRALEAKFCHAWQATLRETLPGKTVRRNYPYLGRSDGLTTSLRKQFGPRRYLGIELEVNQKLTEDARAWKSLRATLTESLVHALRSWR